MEEQPFEIPIDEPKAEFRKHLELEHNKRIIFSAPFGTGKTYFLNNFFKGRPEKVIHLYPVNYSVSSNEDVFELIKFDILLQLLEDENLKLEDNVFDDFFTAQFYLFYNADKFTEWLFDKFGKAGKSINKYSEQLKHIVEGYKEFKKKVEENTDKKEAIDFLLDIKHKTGSAYEEDAITQLIQSFLQQLCGDERQCILIIDDLDRIDPEHIFRLLNVFAAHFDIGKPDTNKFGFDKVIFVCDVNNIRNIFHAKYGTATDFTGYIDKFYNEEIFNFTNENGVLSYIYKTIISRFHNKSIKNIRHLMYLGKGDFLDMLNIVLGDLYLAKALNLRMLKKIFSYTIDIEEYKLSFLFLGNGIQNTDSFIIILFDILKKIYGAPESVFTAIEKAKSINDKRGSDRYSSRNGQFIEFICGHAMPILTFEYFGKEEKGKYQKNLQYRNDELNMTFDLTQNDSKIRTSLIFLSITKIVHHDWNGQTMTINMESINYFELLSLAFLKLQSRGHFIT